MLNVFIAGFICGIIALYLGILLQEWRRYRSPELDPSGLLHRDDVPFELMEQIEAEMSERYPGFKLVCAGDVPADQLPETLKASLAEQQAKCLDSVKRGVCIDCGVAMGDYRPDVKGWRPKERWFNYTSPTGKLMGWQCPACDAAEKEDSQ